MFHPTMPDFRIFPKINNIAKKDPGCPIAVYLFPFVTLFVLHVYQSFRVDHSNRRTKYKISLTTIKC